MPLPCLVRRALLTGPLAVSKSVVGKADVSPKVLTTRNRESGRGSGGCSGAQSPLALPSARV